MGTLEFLENLERQVIEEGYEVEYDKGRMVVAELIPADVLHRVVITISYPDEGKGGKYASVADMQE